MKMFIIMGCITIMYVAGWAKGDLTLEKSPKNYTEPTLATTGSDMLVNTEEPLIEVSAETDTAIVYLGSQDPRMGTAAASFPSPNTHESDKLTSLAQTTDSDGGILVTGLSTMAAGRFTLQPEVEHSETERSWEFSSTVSTVQHPLELDHTVDIASITTPRATSTVTVDAESSEKENRTDFVSATLGVVVFTMKPTVKHSEGERADETRSPSTNSTAITFTTAVPSSQTKRVREFTPNTITTSRTTEEPALEYSKIEHITVDEVFADTDQLRGDTDYEDGKREMCNYDPCVHLQRPCTEVFQNCLCPGLTSDMAPPKSPTVHVGQITHGSAQIVWCAPPSPVLEYLVEARHAKHGISRVESVNSSFRKFTFFGLQEGAPYNICVTAQNRGGVSAPVCAALVINVNNEVYMYTLAGAAALFALLSLILATCLYKQWKKPALGSPHLTSLISIPNPAYCNQEERASSTANIFRI